MKSAVWIPGARRDCQAFVVGRTKVVVQSVCSHTHIQALPGRRPHIRCDGLLEWSLKWTFDRQWERYCNLAMLWDRPHVRNFSRIEPRQTRSTVCNSRQSRSTAVWNPIPTVNLSHVSPLPPTTHLGYIKQRQWSRTAADSCSNRQS